MRSFGAEYFLAWWAKTNDGWLRSEHGVVGRRHCTGRQPYPNRTKGSSWGILRVRRGQSRCSGVWALWWTMASSRLPRHWCDEVSRFGAEAATEGYYGIRRRAEQLGQRARPSLIPSRRGNDAFYMWQYRHAAGNRPIIGRNRAQSHAPRGYH